MMNRLACYSNELHKIEVERVHKHLARATKTKALK